METFFDALEAQGNASKISSGHVAVIDIRFLVVKPASEPNLPPSQLVVVQHFDEELKRLVNVAP